MADEPDARTPSVWMRGVGIVAAALIAVYALVGVLRDDLYVSVSKSSGSGAHLHGFLAWVCFAGLILMAVALARFLAPEPGDGEFNFVARRNRFGPMFAIGVLLYVIPQIIVGLRS